MKHIFHIIVSFAAVSLVSCEMDQMPASGIDQSLAFTDMATIEAAETGAYASLRDAYDTYSITAPDLQCDYMHAAAGFSNTFGNQYVWDYIPSAAEVSGMWNNTYGAIAQVNFILDGIEENAKLEFKPTKEEQKRLDLIRGRLYLMRAMLYNQLAERFCADYDDATADGEYTGVPLVLHYKPDELPSRATLRNTYLQILEDLKNAREQLAEERGAANSTTLNIDCVTALEARVYLQMDNYELAYKRAQSLIGSSAYSLVGTAAEFKDMWTYDRSTEVIYVFYASKTETPPSFGYYFSNDRFSGMQPNSYISPDYIPTQACLDQYDAADWRRAAYFLDCSQTLPIDGRFYVVLLKSGYFAKDLTILYKFPGNPDLRTSTAWNTNNAVKVFRLAEMYLIAAEAAVQSPANTGDAATPLNELRKHRGLGGLGTVTLADVQAERYREMIMEGTRLTDLKRWGLGMKRGEEQTGYVCEDPETPSFKMGDFVTQFRKNLQVAAGDYRFVWPIPESDIFANDKLSQQQNPGWER